MKILKITFLLFLALGSFAQSESLNVGGKVSDERKIAMGGVIVSVTQDGKAFTAFPTSLTGSYALYLPMGFEFVITVSKSGYAKKYFSMRRIVTRIR